MTLAQATGEAILRSGRICQGAATACSRGPCNSHGGRERSVALSHCLSTPTVIHSDRVREDRSGEEQTDHVLPDFLKVLWGQSAG